MRGILSCLLWAAVMIFAVWNNDKPLTWVDVLLFSVGAFAWGGFAIDEWYSRAHRRVRVVDQKLRDLQAAEIQRQRRIIDVEIADMRRQLGLRGASGAAAHHEEVN